MNKFLLLIALLFSFAAFSKSSLFNSLGKQKVKDVVYSPQQEPYITVGAITGSSGSVDNILSNPRLVVNPQEKDPKEAVILQSFVMTIIHGGARKTFETTYGYRFTTDQITAIKSLKPGDVILIEGINGKKITDSLKSFPSVKLTIQ